MGWGVYLKILFGPMCNGPDGSVGPRPNARETRSRGGGEVTKTSHTIIIMVHIAHI